jgi:RNA polymerase sigma-70 factor (ECF subfamily)
VLKDAISAAALAWSEPDPAFFNTLLEVPVRSPNADEGEFRAGALRWLDGLYGFALVLSRDSTVAEDLVQETYLRALRARRKPAPEEGLRVWLFVILHNVWRNQLRRRRPERLLDDVAEVLEVADPRDGPEELLERKRLRAHLQEAIAGLPDSFRQVLVLRCVEGFSYQEVAAIVGCPTGTVMSRLARGRALLRRFLRPSLVASPARERIS